MFDPAILEQYRRDKAAAAAAAAAASPPGDDPVQSPGEEGSPTEAAATEPVADKKDSEEWAKFKLLTSGQLF